jgi:hypothetical protein
LLRNTIVSKRIKNLQEMEEKIETLQVDHFNLAEAKVRMPSVQREGFLKITAFP